MGDVPSAGGRLSLLVACVLNGSELSTDQISDQMPSSLCCVLHKNLNM